MSESESFPTNSLTLVRNPRTKSYTLHSPFLSGDTELARERERERERERARERERERMSSTMSYLYCFYFLEYCNFLFFFLSTAISCIFGNTAGFWSTAVSCIFFCFLGGGGEESRDLHTVLLIIYCLFVSFFFKKKLFAFQQRPGHGATHHFLQLSFHHVRCNQ